VTSVGILYPGEMGAAVAGLLRPRGHSLLTVLDGRSAATRDRAAAAGFTVVESLEALASRTDVIISLVSPAAAWDVARSLVDAAPRPGAGPVYVDANAISPAQAVAIADLMAEAGFVFADAALHGLASRIREDGVLYLSGAGAGRAATLFEGLLPIRNLGDEPGRASALKMLTGGLNKGLAALFIELALAAERAGLLGELLAAYRDKYPGIMQVVERILPSYVRHGERRAQELDEIASALAGWGVEPDVLAGAARRIHRVAGLGGPGRNEPASVDTLITAWSTDREAR
jgi:3-hydroxyisobutyrate dehydrogenase-like beta-hydroxyacid dehydrogenase